ncbi:hypothetical protein B0H21DRAFT_827694 [Amylocystis lapponica]|nr:hypothetical protein B0H21DRAFT_827694 [Amylocystis lapponica]
MAGDFAAFMTERRTLWSPGDFIDAIFGELRIVTVLQAVKQPVQGLGLTFWGDSEIEWEQLPEEPIARKEWTNGHKANSSLTSLLSLPSLTALDYISSSAQAGVAGVDTIICDNINDLERYSHVADAFRWSDEVLERDTAVKQIPPTHAMVHSLLPDVAPVQRD